MISSFSQGSNGKFEIVTPNRIFEFTDAVKGGDYWCDVLNELFPGSRLSIGASITPRRSSVSSAFDRFSLSGGKGGK